MRIKFRTSIAGQGFSYGPGQIADWPDVQEAERFIRAGYADKVEQPTLTRSTTPATERAELQPGTEQAIQPPAVSSDAPPARETRKTRTKK